MHKIRYYNGNMYAEKNLFNRLQKLNQHTNTTLFDIMYEMSNGNMVCACVA